MAPGFILGLIAFVFILLMFQILRLMEFFLIHGVEFKTIFEILYSMSISFLPALLPMASLFAVVLATSRFSSDSESVSFISLGLSPLQLSLPVIVLSFMVSLFSLYASFDLAPNGNRQFELIMQNLSQSKITSAIKENAFTESFYNLVIFAKKSDTKTGELGNIFIFEEQLDAPPLTVMAQSGKVYTTEDPLKTSLWLSLDNGDIHRQEQRHTKIHFKNFEVKLTDSQKVKEEIEKSPNSWTYYDLKNKISESHKNQDQAFLYQTEFYKRWALGGTCFILSILGFTISFSPNRRVKTGGFIISLGIVLSYWIILVTLETISKDGLLPAPLAMWTPNLIYLSYAGFRFKKLMD